MRDGSTISIVVCVSPLDADSRGPSALSDLDTRAVEAAVALAGECVAGAFVTAVAVGGESAPPALVECSARGVERTVWIRAEGEAATNGYVVAELLAREIAAGDPDLVLCGQRSQDGMHGTVPLAVANRLGLPFLGDVVALEPSWSRREIRAVQRLERGDRWAWEADLPLVCSVEREIVEPRYLAVRRRDRAAAMTPAPTLADGVPALAESLEQRMGPWRVEAPIPPRIRPKKTKAPPKAMSAADRMKFLRGGGKPTPSAGTNGQQRVSGSPEAAAEAIIKLLEEDGLLP